MTKKLAAFIPPWWGLVLLAYVVLWWGLFILYYSYLIIRGGQMSASNLAKCPQWIERRASSLAEMEANLRALKESYGKIPLEDLAKEMTKVSVFRDQYLDETFREDYEICTDGGWDQFPSQKE